MFFFSSTIQKTTESPPPVISCLRNGVVSQYLQPQLRWQSSALKQDCRVLSVLEHIKHSPQNAAQNQVKQNKKGTNNPEQSIKSAGSGLLSRHNCNVASETKRVYWISASGKLVLRPKWKKKKIRERRELCGQDSLNNRGGLFFL